MEFGCVKEQITEFIKNDVLGARNEKIFTSLVLNNEAIAKEVYRDTYGQPGYPSRYKIITVLTNVCRGEDIAREEVNELVHRLSFRDCSPESAREFTGWLVVEHGDMPSSFPMEKKVQGFFSRQQYRTICYISKVSQFSARLCVYGMVKGYIELFKDTLQNIITEFGVDYARNFIDQSAARYDVADSYLMAMVSVIYAGPAKTKLETQLYREYIDKWSNSNRDYFMTEIGTVLGVDWHKKVLRKFEKDGI